MTRYSSFNEPTALHANTRETWWTRSVADACRKLVISGHDRVASNEAKVSMRRLIENDHASLGGWRTAACSVSARYPVTGQPG